MRLLSGVHGLATASWIYERIHPGHQRGRGAPQEKPLGDATNSLCGGDRLSGHAERGE